MFKYNDFEIERLDGLNLGLFQWKSVPVYETSEDKIPRKTPEVRRKRIRLGFYSQFSSAIKGLIDKNLEECRDIKELSEMLKKLKSELTGVVE
jgi:hypothetical protein